MKRRATEVHISPRPDPFVLLLHHWREPQLDTLHKIPDSAIGDGGMELQRELIRHALLWRKALDLRCRSDVKLLAGIDGGGNRTYVSSEVQG